MTDTVLHVLSQRPALTGSGVTLDAIVKCAARSGWRQHVVVGVPLEDSLPKVASLPRENVHPLIFGRADLPFPLPGMSDVMPYRSTRFAEMSAEQITAYQRAWQSHLRAVVAEVQPDIIHSHHVWLVSAFIKDVAPKVKVVTHCHATGLRQMSLAPHLAESVLKGCRRNDHFFALHDEQAAELGRLLNIEESRISVIGAGYNEELFHTAGRRSSPTFRLVYAGKLSSAKGLPWLLDAVRQLTDEGVQITLDVAGSGSTEEARLLRQRLADFGSNVRYHGHLSQEELANLLRASSVFVLPSFYEGLPLVLVEALASGCRLVSTRLPGVTDRLVKYFQDAVELVPLPRMRRVDTPDPADLPSFTSNLADAIRRAIHLPPLDSESSILKAVKLNFSWSSVFARIESVWNSR